MNLNPVINYRFGRKTYKRPPSSDPQLTSNGHLAIIDTFCAIQKNTDRGPRKITVHASQRNQPTDTIQPTNQPTNISN